MTKLEEKIYINLIYTKKGETNEQKAARIADSVRIFLEKSWVAGVVNATTVDNNIDYAQWIRKNNI